MVTDVNRHCGDNFAIKPICCTFQNNTSDMSVIPTYVETIHTQKLHKYFLKVKKECERKSYIRRNWKAGRRKIFNPGMGFYGSILIK